MTKRLSPERIFIYWNEKYRNKLEPYTKEALMLNATNHIFTPLEYRSFREIEVFLCPANSDEYSYAKLLLKECNKYGVVALIKNSMKEEKLRDYGHNQTT